MGNILKRKKATNKREKKSTEMTDIPMTITPISLAFQLFVPPNDNLSISGIDRLPLHQQMDILNVSKMSTTKSRDALIENLTAELSDLQHSATKQQQFHSLLSTFYDEYSRLNDTSPSEWDEMQLPFSLFLYSMNRLRRQPQDDQDRSEFVHDMTTQNAMWPFIHYLIRFCAEKQWDGMKMQNYWIDISQNGINKNGFGHQFIKMVYVQYGQEIEKHVGIARTISVWYPEAMEQQRKADQVQERAAFNLNDGTFFGDEPVHYVILDLDYLLSATHR